MKKRGFTLIELLAVIVILAIIALIATPIVMNVIENSRKGAAERSVENYLHAVETAIATERLDGNILEGTYLINEDGNLCAEEDGVKCSKPITIDMSGNRPSSGNIIITNGLVSNFQNIIIDGKVINKSDNGFVVGDANQIIHKVELDAVNLYNKDELRVGYYNNVSSGKYYSNSAYIATGYIPVTPGDSIYYDLFFSESHVWVSELYQLYPTRFTKFNVRFINAFDSDKKLIASTTYGSDGIDWSEEGYVVPEGASYIVITFNNPIGLSSNSGQFQPITTYDYIMISTKPITEYVSYNEQGYYEVYAYLPNKIDVAVGKEVKLYNNNIVPKSLKDSKLTFKWDSEIGTEETDGLKILPISNNIGMYEANLLIYYEDKLIDNVSTVINIVDSEIASNVSLLPIGDSLTNNKIWKYHIIDYSEEKISLVGTKSHIFNGIEVRHEGISGATVTGYYKEEILANYTNNFYNSEVGHFDYNYYKTQNNINPNGVILFLGTNELFPYNNSGLDDLNNIINEIKSDDSSAEIYLVTPTVRGNQSYFYNISSLYYLKRYEEKYGNDSKVHIVPLVLTVDSYNSFDDGDDTHPNDNGYIEFANTIYASISANN